MKYLLMIGSFLGQYSLFPQTEPGPKELISHASLLREMKELPLFPAIETDPIEEVLKGQRSPQTPHTATHKYTQTEAYLRVYFDIPASVILSRSDLEHYVRKILENFDRLLQYHKIDENDVIRLCMGMIDNEFRYANDYVFYHAFKKEIGILFDVQREVHNILEMSGASVPLIRDIYQITSMASLFPYKSAQELLEKKPTIEDYNEPWNIYLLSANLALFGNREDSGADSILFLLASMSISRVDFLTNFFKTWQFNESYKTKIENLYNSLHGSTGHILQIFIPESQINTFTYLSQIGGTPYQLDKITESYNERLKYHPDMLEVLKKYRNNPYKIAEFKSERALPDWRVIDRLQARILLIPEFFDPTNGIKVLQFNLTPDKKVQEYRKKLRILIQEMFVDWLKKPEIKQLLKKHQTGLGKLMNYIEGGTLYNSVREFNNDLALIQILI